MSSPAIRATALGVTDALPLPPDALIEGLREELKGKTLIEVTQWRDKKPIRLLEAIGELFMMNS